MPFISASAISPYNDIRGGAEGGVTGTLLLDLYPGAAAAYSLRHLRTAYSGSAIQVRRSSDDSLQDIGFVDGNLDTASLLSFVGSGDGFVKIWYDQSGEGNDAAQGSASNQPKIVSSGVVITENGKPSVEFNGTTDYIQNQLSVGATVTAFAVSKIVDEPDYNFIYDSFGTGARLRLGLWVTQEYFADNGDGLVAEATTASNGLQNLFFAKHTNSDVSISVNQDTLQTVESTNFSQNSEFWNIGARNDGAEHFLEGTIQELILYPSDQSANRRAIETNTNNYYSIYPTVLDFNPYNVWDSEHISINNTTTTFTDFNTVGTTYDLVNPAASNQPAYTSSDSVFKGLPSITFDGIAEYVSKSITNYRNSDSSGLVAGVLLIESGSNFDFLGSTGLSSSEIMGSARIISNKYRPRIANGSFDNRISASTTTIGTLTPYVFTFASTGSEYKITINGVQQSISVSLGNNDGKWYDDVSVQNIAVGLLPSRNLYSNITWCMSGYFPYVDDATTESLTTALKNKYIDAPIPVDPILAFNPTNVWDSEHIIIDGDETTFVDFNNSGEGSYNLSNPAATNQPSFNQSSSSFNNLPSFTFDGLAAAPDYVTASVSNFRGSDSSGVVINVVRIVGSNLIAGLGSYNTASSFNYLGYSLANVGNKVRIISAAPSAATASLRIYLGSTDVLAGSPPFAFANVSTGSEYKIFVDNAEDVVTVTNSPSGNDGAIWFNDGTQDNIAIGARNGSTIAGQGNIEWCFSGYFPYESDSQVQGIMDYLVTKYNL